MPAITDEQIAALVDRFYGKIRTDGMLGPIFAAAIGEDWTPHLARMKAFWSTVVRGPGLGNGATYKGNPMVAHLGLPSLTREHFDHWLQLWRETVAEVCGDGADSIFVRKAEMIAERLLDTITLYREAMIEPAVVRI